MMQQSELREYLAVLVEKGEMFMVSTARDVYPNQGDMVIITMGGKTYRVNEEALRCDCGKHIHCPLVKQGDES